MSDNSAVKTSFPYSVLLEDVRSAHNVGAIFRTLDGAGASRLYLAGITPYPPHNRIPKTALGAIEYVAWEHHPDVIALATKLKAEGHQLIAVEQTTQSKAFAEVTYADNCVLIFGNEISGVSAELLELADLSVQVPMFGHKNSLNIATTVGIVCYQLALQFNAQT